MKHRLHCQLVQFRSLNLSSNIQLNILGKETLQFITKAVVLVKLSGPRNMTKCQRASTAGQTCSSISPASTNTEQKLKKTALFHCVSVSKLDAHHGTIRTMYSLLGDLK